MKPMYTIDYTTTLLSKAGQREYDRSEIEIDYITELVKWYDNTDNINICSATPEIKAAMELKLQALRMSSTCDYTKPYEIGVTIITMTRDDAGLFRQIEPSWEF